MKVRKSIWAFLALSLLAASVVFVPPIRAFFSDVVLNQLGTIYWTNAGAMQVIQSVNSSGSINFQEAQTLSGETPIVKISSATAGNVFSVTQNGHFVVNASSSPTASANCAIAATSSDTAGEVTISGGATSACTVTFSNPFAQAPFCVAADTTTTTSTVQTAATTTAIVLTLSSSRNDGITWACFGH